MAQLKSPVPIAFFDCRLDRSIVAYKSPESYPNQLIDLLQSRRLRVQIGAGRLTLGLIRPTIGGGHNTLGFSDTECAHEIERRVTHLGIAAKFSFWFTPEAAADFYGAGPRADMLTVPAVGETGRYENRWEQFSDVMTGGATTALLLHSSTDGAPGIWRQQMGKRVGPEGTPGTIRGDLAFSRLNDLVHGSDSPEAATRELDVIIDCIAPEARTRLTA